MKLRSPESRSFFNSSRLQRLVLLSGLCLVQSLAFPTPRAAATPPPGETVSATIVFGDGESIALRARDRFRALAVLAGETIRIDAQLPPQWAGTPAFAQPLDGGSASEFVIAADGSTSITFQVGVEPGLYRLLLGALGRTVTLQFEVPASGG